MGPRPALGALADALWRGRWVSALIKTDKRTNGAQKVVRTPAISYTRLGWSGQPFGSFNYLCKGRRQTPCFPHFQTTSDSMHSPLPWVQPQWSVSPASPLPARSLEDPSPVL